MAKKNFIFCWVSIFALQSFVFLTILENQKTARGQENTVTSTKCEMYNESLICNIQCSDNCFCILDDVKVTNNCTGGNVTLTQVMYPSNPKYLVLSWDYSRFHDINPGAFMRFGKTLEELWLAKIGLRNLQQGIFDGLTILKYLDLSYNEVSVLLPGVFGDLVNLTDLDLSYNVINGINRG